MTNPIVPRPDHKKFNEIISVLSDPFRGPVSSRDAATVAFSAFNYVCSYYETEIAKLAAAAAPVANNDRILAELIIIRSRLEKTDSEGGHHV